MQVLITVQPVRYRVHFDKQTNTWHAAGAAYSGTDYSYPTTGTSSLAGIRGDWLRLELPYKVKLSSIYQSSNFGNENSTGDQSPEDFTILGNNDNGIWTVIQSFTGKSWSDIRSTTIPITTGPEAYNSFAIVITKVANSTGLTIAELRYFGTREQGASTLHNGELSLTRNLTVPRIGPPLDADDTPRRDRLVVEYNTSTNPAENGVVKDTSGRGLMDLHMTGRPTTRVKKHWCSMGLMITFFKTMLVSRRVWVVSIVHPCGSEMRQNHTHSLLTRVSRNLTTSTKRVGYHVTLCFTIQISSHVYHSKGTGQTLS